ncbi:MAG: response regulator transcription factor [Mycobacteriaceae bacterium]
MFVSLSTLEKAVRLVDDVAELKDPSGFAELVLPALCQLIRCDAATYIEVGPQPAQVRCGEFFRPIPAEYQLAITLADPGKAVIGITLNRSRHDFAEADRAVLGVLREPLAAGLTRARRRAQAHAALRTAPSTTLAELTDREWQVLELVALGRTNRAIARTMAVSPRTVAKHLEHVYAKLNVTSRAAAVTRSMSSAGEEVVSSAATTRIGPSPARRPTAGERGH